MTASAVLHTIVLSVPLRVLTYYPFFDRLRIPKTALALVIASSTASQFYLQGLAVRLPAEQPALNNFLYVLPLLIAFAAYFLCVRANKGEMFFVAFLNLNAYSLLNTVALYLEAALLPPHGCKFDCWYNVGFLVLANSLVLPPLFFILRNFRRHLREVNAPDMWRSLWLLPLPITLLTIFFNGKVSYEDAANPVFFISRSIMFLYFLTACLALLYAIRQFKRTLRLKAREAFMRQREETLRVQYGQLQQKIEQTRRVRHDIRHHLRLIRRHLEDGSTAALTAYLDSCERSLPEAAAQRYAQNDEVNAIVCHYAEQAAAADVRFDAQIALPRALPAGIEIADLCVLLGNLLENAVEGCQRQRGGERTLRLAVSAPAENVVTLGVRNSYDGDARIENGLYASSKRLGLGVGLSSVRSIAQKYNGYVEIDSAGREFCVSVMLCLRVAQ